MGKPCIVVEQLNRSQWHVVFPDGRWGGVVNWATAISDALLFGSADGYAVHSLDLDGTRLLMARADPAVIAEGRA